MSHIFTKLAFLLICSALPKEVYSNTGVFYGAGNNVIPIKNNNIQMKEEEVIIILKVTTKPGKHIFPFFGTFIPIANVIANFYLNNMTDKNVQLQLGFPFLSTQGFSDENSIINN